MRSNLNAARVGRFGDDIHGGGYALSLEAGHKVALGNEWSLTPQAQLAYSSVGFDAFTDPFGANVSLRQGDSLKGRLGVAANYDNDASGSHVYGIANLSYEFLDGTQVAVSGVDLAFEPSASAANLASVAPINGPKANLPYMAKHLPRPASRADTASRAPSASRRDFRPSS